MMKLATGDIEIGNSETFIVAVFEAVPFALLTVRLTVYVPAVEYVCTGLKSVELVPSPKSQSVLFAFCEVS